MSGKEFFVRRYEEMGWNYHPVRLEQAIRINTINARETDVLERLQSRGIALERIPFLESGYWVRRSRFSVGATTEYLLGLYSIQEAAAQIPASLFTGLEGKTVLDACAAPGGKTVQLADLMQNTGAVIALDFKKGRLTALVNQLERCRIKNTIVYHMDARRVSGLGMRFDRILLDVPCSGNYATDEEWFQKRTINDVERNADVQRQIIAEATRCLADDGEIVYATCSLEPEEDELNIDWAINALNLQTQKIDCPGEKPPANILGKQLDNAVENCRRIWPERTQGFFICKLKRENAQ